MARLIDADKLAEFPIRRNHCDKNNANPAFINGIETVMEYAEALPTIDAVPVVHGRWERRSDCNGFLCCSRCHDVFIEDEWLDDGKWSYCPNCGAKMDLEGNRNDD